MHFGYDLKQRDALNYRQTLKDIKKAINMWKWRGLSLLGRIQIIKTFAIPKLMYRASVIPFSKELIKEANSIFYSFIWNGKDKVKRLALISDFKKGGLKMSDVESMIKAKRVNCLKKFREDYRSPWKAILDKLLSPIGGRFVLYCNFDTSKLKIQFPAYYKECFDVWSELNGKKPSSSQDVVNEIIWNNKFFCIEKMSLYRKDLIDLGFLKIGDVISINNFFSPNVISPCQEEAESIEHLLFSCRKSSEFWKYLLSWLRDNGIRIEILKETDLIFGKFDSVDDFIIINHMLLLGKYYIYSMRYQKNLPNLSGFIARTRHTYNIELYIARENNKLDKHLKKWEKLIKVLT